MKVDLEGKRGKTMYIFVHGHQNAWQNCDMEVANRCPEFLAQLKYLGTAETN
jgi:hypothetical protein